MWPECRGDADLRLLRAISLPWRKLVPVPAGLDAAEAVAVVLNYVTAYQMLHRSAKARAGQRMLIHGASGGVAVGEAGWRRDVRNMLGTGRRSRSGIGRPSYRLQERRLRGGNPSPYR